uniref:Si:ch73-335l21.4 n=1 Tax=Scleropages formosus TaxID=113540 RepID=A0A8C9WC63_SCLFO
MRSELECSVCYRTYNVGPRCPRELHCRHTFCESCLSTLAARGDGTRRQLSIACPLCRHRTPLPAGGAVRQALRVDEDVLSQMVAAGLLEGTPREDSDSEDGDGGDGKTAHRMTDQDLKDLALMSCYMM